MRGEDNGFMMKEKRSHLGHHILKDKLIFRVYSKSPSLEALNANPVYLYTHSYIHTSFSLIPVCILKIL